MQNFWNLKFLRTPTCIYSEVFHSNFNFDEYIYICIYVHMRMLTNYKCTVSVYVALQPHAYVHSNSSNVNNSHGDGSRYICCVVCAVLCCDVLCCDVLCNAVPCCAVLCCTALRCACTTLCCAVLCCAVLCCAVLCCSVLCCAALDCAVLC